MPPAPLERDDARRLVHYLQSLPLR
jgi:hypothetical protein